MVNLLASCTKMVMRCRMSAASRSDPGGGLVVRYLPDNRCEFLSGGHPAPATGGTGQVADDCRRRPAATDPAVDLDAVW